MTLTTIKSFSMNPPENKFAPIVLTDKQLAWLDKHFKHTKNEDIARRLNISARSVNRIAKRRGLKKSSQFIRKCQLAAAEKANLSNRINGTYPPKGYKIPNREKYHFRKGVKPIDMLGAKREAERVAKSVESRRKTFRLEKARALYGLPRETKLNVVKRPRKQILMRYELKKRGYIIERGGFVAYYDENTRRHLAIESKPMTGFTFKAV